MLYICMHVCICMYVCMCACTYVHMYVYVYMFCMCMNAHEILIIITKDLVPNSFMSKNTTVNDKSTAGRFDPKVFVNCVHS